MYLKTFGFKVKKKTNSYQLKLLKIFIYYIELSRSLIVQKSCFDSKTYFKPKSLNMNKALLEGRQYLNNEKIRHDKQQNQITSINYD